MKAMNTGAVALLLLLSFVPMVNQSFLDDYPFHGHLYLDPSSTAHKHRPVSVDHAVLRAMIKLTEPARTANVVSFVASSGVLADAGSISVPMTSLTDLVLDIHLLLRVLEHPMDIFPTSALVSPLELPPRA